MKAKSLPKQKRRQMRSSPRPHTRKKRKSLCNVSLSTCQGIIINPSATTPRQRGGRSLPKQKRRQMRSSPRPHTRKNRKPLHKRVAKGLPKHNKKTKRNDPAPARGQKPTKAKEKTSGHPPPHRPNIPTPTKHQKKRNPPPCPPDAQPRRAFFTPVSRETFEKSPTEKENSFILSGKRAIIVRKEGNGWEK